MLIVAVLFVERLGILVDALLLSKAPILATLNFGIAWAFSKRGSMIIVGGGVTGIWSSNSSECASLLVAIPESSSRPNRKWWLLTVESELSLHAFWFFAFDCFVSFARLFKRKSMLPQVHGTFSIFWSFHNWNSLGRKSQKHFPHWSLNTLSIYSKSNRWQWKNKNMNKSSAYAIGTKTFLLNSHSKFNFFCLLSAKTNVLVFLMKTRRVMYSNRSFQNIQSRANLNKIHDESRMKIDVKFL